MTTPMPMFPTFTAEAWDGTRPNETFLQNHQAAGEEDCAEATSRADTLARLVDLLDETGQDDYGTIDPTQHAFVSAFKLVRDAQKQMVFSVAGSPSVDSMGGIRITWMRADRELRLVCPGAKTESIYVYQQSEHRNQAIHGLTPTVLAQKLSWLVSGGDPL